RDDAELHDVPDAVVVGRDLEVEEVALLGEVADFGRDDSLRAAPRTPETVPRGDRPPADDADGGRGRTRDDGLEVAFRERRDAERGRSREADRLAGRRSQD